MRFGISAGALIMRDEKLLMVNHDWGPEQSFWVPPGGSLEGQESIFDCVQREAFEETGLQVAPKKIVYVQEFANAERHFVKFFIWCEANNTAVTLANREPEETFLKEARFMNATDMNGQTIYPPVLRDQFWQDLETGLPQAQYLGLFPLD